MPTSDELIELDGIGQRSSEVRFDLLDATLQLVGTIQPDVTGAVVEQNTSRRVNRTLSGINLNGAVQATVDPFGHRLRPVWVLENGAEYPLGVFIFGSMDRMRHEWGLDAEVAAVDQTIILDQPLEQTVAYDQGHSVRDAIIEQFTLGNVPSFNVDPGITTEVANPISWPAGQGRRLDVINDLAAMASAYSAWFDNTGTGQVVRVPDLANTIPTLVYGDGGRILADSMVETDDLLDAPNRYIVIDSGNPEAPIVGYYDVPPEAPHSFAHRGFYVPTVIAEQGLPDVAAANARAAAAYAQDQGTYEWVQFSAAPDPRHDTHDGVLYRNVVYREQGWKLPLYEGAEHVHDLRRVYPL